MNTTLRNLTSAALLTLRVVAFAQSTGGDPEIVSVTPITPGAPVDTRMPQRDPNAPAKVVDLPSYDSNDKFSYSVSKDDSSVVVVVPNDGSNPVHVSSNFLGMVMNDTNTNNSDRLEHLKAYETMTLGARQHFMEDMFPDGSAQTKPFQSAALQIGDKDVILEQDPKAGPYVRVTITDKNGNVTAEFSISKTLAEQISGASSMTPEEKLALLGDSANYLPEAARADFANLSREGLTSLVDQKPEIAGQEFTKMARLIVASRTQTPEQRLAEMKHSFSSGATPRAKSASSRSTGRSLGRSRGDQNADDAPATTVHADKTTANAHSLPHLRLFVLALITLLAILTILIRSTMVVSPRPTRSTN